MGEVPLNTDGVGELQSAFLENQFYRSNTIADET